MQNTLQRSATVNHVAAVPRKRGRPIGIGRCRARKRLEIANAVVAGRPIAEVARELGVSRSWASREPYAPGTGDLVNALVAEHWQHIHALLNATLGVIEDALSARKIKCGVGEVLDLGPDYRVRMKAVKLYIRLLKAIRSLDLTFAQSDVKTSHQCRPRTPMALQHGFLRTLTSISGQALALAAPAR